MSDREPEWATDVAATIMAEMSLIGADRSHTDFVASALLSAYRRGVEESAKVAEGEPHHGRYRTWPWWLPQADGTRGNRSNESELVQHADNIAAAIRRLGEAE